MIVDASVLVAIALSEPGAEELVALLAGAPGSAIGAPSAAEAAVVLEHRFPGRGEVILRELVARFVMVVLPFPADLWADAHAAYARFGKGRHPAQLNFGDCLCYAVARAAGMPLLCTGADFRKTDLEVVSW